MVYIGTVSDFAYNPRIRPQKNKQFPLQTFSQIDCFKNPPIVFCYSHRIAELARWIHLFQHDFVLITHNSDHNITEEVLQSIQPLVDSPRLLHWFAQNLCCHHEKLSLLPIGIANSQWPHGDGHLFATLLPPPPAVPEKTKKTYFHFQTHTNLRLRNACYHALQDRIPFLPAVSPKDNLQRLSEYEFCICPEGNGADTHRLWECLYVKTIPIVLDGPFTRVLQRHGIPLVVLASWEEYDESLLTYDSDGLAQWDPTWLSLCRFREKIQGRISSQDNASLVFLE